MKKGFFISVDLIITIASVILLLGVLGAYVHESIQNFVDYKDDVSIQATMNIALNRLSLSEYSCDLVSDSNVFIKKIAFCIDSNKIENPADLYALEYMVTLSSDKLISIFNPDNAKKYIAKDVTMWVSNGPVKKSKYYACTQGACDLNTMVRVYVWSPK
jgi:hypothetical protein